MPGCLPRQRRARAGPAQGIADCYHRLVLCPCVVTPNFSGCIPNSPRAPKEQRAQKERKDGAEKRKILSLSEEKKIWCRINFFCQMVWSFWPSVNGTLALGEFCSNNFSHSLNLFFLYLYFYIFSIHRPTTHTRQPHSHTSSALYSWHSLPQAPSKQGVWLFTLKWTVKSFNGWNICVPDSAHVRYTSFTHPTTSIDMFLIIRRLQYSPLAEKVRWQDGAPATNR